MASDPFERHGIDHLSPSSLRLYRDCPAVWCGKYLLKATDESGPGAWRGLAVEAGVGALLHGLTIDFATDHMRSVWDAQAQGVVEEDALKEYDALPDFLAQAHDALHTYPVPLQQQAKISLQLPGISVPLVGYADWIWPHGGTDLKTTWRIPSQAPDPSHVEQVACYSMHFGRPFTLTYVSPKKWTRFEVTQAMASEGWDRVIETAHAVRSMLERVRDAHDALSMFSPDYTDYHWRPQMIEAVKAAKAVRVLTPYQGAPA